VSEDSPRHFGRRDNGHVSLFVSGLTSPGVEDAVSPDGVSAGWEDAAGVFGWGGECRGDRLELIWGRCPLSFFFAGRGCR
jgi:hypothetical protein